MSEVKWIKITTNIFDDEKIKLIETLPDSDTLLVIWFKLLTLAGKCNEGGLIYLTRDVPYNPEMLSTILRRPVNTIRLALNEFSKLRMIEIFDDIISIINWEKHQTLHKLEMAKEQTRLRVQKHRDGQKALCNVTVTKCNADRLDKIRLDKNIKEFPEGYSELFEYWNSKEYLITHKDISIFTKAFSFKRFKELNEIYNIDELKKAIDNYNEILSSKKYFFDYKWSIGEFFSRNSGVHKFLDSAEPLKNFKNKYTERQQTNWDSLTDDNPL